MGHIFWSFDLILHFCGQMPFGTIIQNNFTISHPFGMNPLHLLLACALEDTRRLNPGVGLFFTALLRTYTH